jgi:hypothetical protein
MTGDNGGRVCTGSKWLTPATCVAFGGVVLLAGWLGGQLVTGLIGLVVMACFGLVIAVSGRSETIRGLRGDARDERFAQIDLRATAATGLVLIVVLVVAFLVEVARGHSGNPYAWLGAIAGLTYALSVAVLRWRG